MSRGASCFCLLAVLLVGCSGKVVTEKPNINAVTESIKKENIRKNTIKQVAREYGTQSGLAWQARFLNVMLNRYEPKLNTIFNFNFLYHLRECGRLLFKQLNYFLFGNS